MVSMQKILLAAQVGSQVVIRLDLYMTRTKRPDSEARTAFCVQRAGAKRRGIAWDFTFEDWMAVWTESGHFAERGRNKGQYVMARNGDTGPYARGNVSIILHSRNMSDAHVNVPEKCSPARRIGTGKGWSINKLSKKNPYHVMHCGKYVGVFSTEDDARRAYLHAVEQTRLQVAAGSLRSRATE